MKKIKRGQVTTNAVELFLWQGLLWSRCVLRKPMRAHTGGPDLAAGTVAWRPVTNGRWRMNRLGYVPMGAEIVVRSQNKKEED